jgi:hypothetical protein
MLRHFPQWWKWWHLPQRGLLQPQSAAVEHVGVPQLGAAQFGAAQPQETADVQETPQPQLLPHSLWNSLQ